LRVKLHKSETNDQNEKGAELRGWCWSLIGEKLHKIWSLKPIRGVIERNKKSKDLIELYRNGIVLITVYLLHFAWKDCTRSYFLGTFNASSLHQIWQNTHQNDGLTFDYTPKWFSLDDWHHIHDSAAPKWLTWPTFLQPFWQSIIVPLSQRLRSFRFKSKANIWHQ
jgi:hypothetical protein